MSKKAMKISSRKKRPFIAIRFAASLDGKIATKTRDSKWITNEQSRAFERKIRAAYQAILVGVNTVLRDNPHLGARIKGKKDPLRIILDSRLKIPLRSQVLRDNNVLVVTTAKAPSTKNRLLMKRGITVLTLPGQKILLPELMRELAKMNIVSLLVEGGGTILGNFADHKLLDKVYVVHAPLLIGGEKAVSAIRGRGVKFVKDAIHLKNVSHKFFGDNLLTVGYPK